MFSNFFRKSCLFGIMSKDRVELERPQTIWRLRGEYWVSKDTRAQAHAFAGAPTHRETHTDARTHMSSLSRTHTHTHTHTHTQIEPCNTYCCFMATAVS
jgi:hypothetical protein